MIIMGLVLSVVLFQAVRAWERRALVAQVNRMADDRVELLRHRTLRSMEVLHSIASLYAARGELNREEFRAFCAGSLTRQPELFALGWSPVVEAKDRPTYEAAARKAGAPLFHFTELDEQGRCVRADERAEYCPVLLIEPLAPNGQVLGFDLFSSPIREATLRRAQSTGQATTTPPLKLVQEADGGRGLVVYLPVYGHPKQLAGFVSAVFRVDDLVGLRAGFLAAKGSRIRVIDESAPSQILYESGSNTRVDGETLGSGRLDLAGMRWRVEVSPGTAVANAAFGQSRIVLWAGFSLTAVLGWYLYSSLRRTGIVEKRVVERTARLAAEVAERRRAEEAARLAEARYRGIFEHATEGIFQTTPDGHYIAANPALARVYGYASPDDLVRDLADIAARLYVNPERRAQFVQQVQRDGSVMAFESQVYRRDGAIIWISENARPVRGADGEVAYYEGTVIDVTARKLAEETGRRIQDELERRVAERTAELALYNEALCAEVLVRQKAELRAASANEAKGRFLANLSHEIRTPMNAILGYAQILRRDNSLRDDQREAMGAIASSGDHLLALIDDILDLSKIEAGRVELYPVEFDLERQIDEVAAMFRQRCGEKGLELIVQNRAALSGASRARGDQRKLRQVLINLMGNAVKFTDKGFVRLTVERSAEGLITFEVTDTGPGIAPEAIAVVFEPFQQGPASERRGGAGLGLAISRQYVELMGGKLGVESGIGKGARFSFAVDLKLSPSATTLAQAIEEMSGARPPSDIDRPVAASDPPNVESSNELSSDGLNSEILSRLARAAELCSVTDLKTCIAELDASGATGPAVRELKRCAKAYDMPGVKRVLSRISSSSAPIAAIPVEVS